MDLEAPALTKMSSSPHTWTKNVTLTFDPHNLGAKDYPVSVLPKLFKLIMRYRNNICPNEQINEQDNLKA